MEYSKQDSKQAQGKAPRQESLQNSISRGAMSLPQGQSQPSPRPLPAQILKRFPLPMVGIKPSLMGDPIQNRKFWNLSAKYPRFQPVNRLWHRWLLGVF